MRQGRAEGVLEMRRMVGLGGAGEWRPARLRSERIVVGRQIDRGRDQRLGERILVQSAAQQRVLVEESDLRCGAPRERIECERVATAGNCASIYQRLRHDAQLD